MFTSTTGKIKHHSNLSGIEVGSVNKGLSTNNTQLGLYLVCKKATGALMTRAEIIADIGQILIKLDGNTIINATAQQLLDIYKYYFDAFGAHTVEGIIPIKYTRPHLASAVERSIWGLGMANIDSYTVDVKIKAVATLSSIEVYTEQELSQRVLGKHIRVESFNRSFAATGVQDLGDLPKNSNKYGYLAMHIGESTSDISKVSVETTFQEYYDEVTMELNNLMLNSAKRAAQTDYYHVDFNLTNDLSSYVPMLSVKEMLLQIDWLAASGAPGSYDIMVERLFGLDEDRPEIKK